METGRALRLCRKARGLTLRIAATRAGITPAYLSLVERGQRDMRCELLARLSAVLSLSPSTIIFIADHAAIPTEWSLDDIEAAERLFAMLGSTKRYRVRSIQPNT